MLYSGLPEGGIAVALMSGTYALLGLPPSRPLLATAFCGTLLVYLGERTLGSGREDRFNHPKRRAWLQRYATLLGGGALLAGLGTIAAARHLRPQTLLAGALLGALSLSYAMPLLPGERRLKAVGGLKPALIAGAWAGGGVALPVLEAGAALDSGSGLLLGYRFLFILPNALWSDWPDRVGDRRAGLRTVATAHSGQWLWSVSSGALGLCLVGGLWALLTEQAPTLLAVDLVGPALMWGAVWVAPRAPRWFYVVVLDALVAWPGVTALVGGGG